jgi:hypothetical protein
MKDFLFGCIIAAIFLAIVTGAIVGIDYYASKKACENQTSMMGLEYKYGLYERCMINDPVYGWIPFDKYFILMSDEGK